MCGIFGIINHHKRLLDKRAFITLGCANDARGGDACGIMIDGLVEKGTDKENKYFQVWFKNSSVLKNTEKCYVALGHCRKASVGGVTANKAQPVTIYDGDKLVFCVIHNGTIYNYEELAKKYIPEIDIKGLSDSQVMAQIFYHAGYDVLQEYEGGGAFVIQDYRTNKTLFFRGKSKINYTAKAPEEERPLYFVTTGKSVVFSSIYNILQGLYWGFEVYDMPSNALLQCDGKDVYIVKEYDRSECYGFKVTKYKKELDGKDFLKHTYGYGVYDYNNFTEIKDDYSYRSSYSKVSFDVKQGLYYNDELKAVLHGAVNINYNGRIVSFESLLNKKYYFWGGIMLFGENAYNALREFVKDKTHTRRQIMLLARLLSANPVMVNGKYYLYAMGEKLPACDSYIFPLTNLEVMFNPYGKVIGTYQEKEIWKFDPVNIEPGLVKQMIEYVEKKGL